MYVVLTFAFVRRVGRGDLEASHECERRGGQDCAAERNRSVSGVAGREVLAHRSLAAGVAPGERETGHEHQARERSGE